MVHGLIRCVADQRRSWAGLDLDFDDWKRLLVDAFDRARGLKGRAVPSLDFDGVVMLGTQTRNFSKAEASEFREFMLAWGTTHEIEFPEGGE